MSFPLTFAVAIAITRGAILISPLWSVGPYREACDPPGRPRFACLDLQGVPARAYETWIEADERQYGTDWSAFGAAQKFVELAGHVDVERALAKLDGGPRTRAVDVTSPALTAST